MKKDELPKISTAQRVAVMLLLVAIRILDPMNFRLEFKDEFKRINDILKND